MTLNLNRWTALAALTVVLGLWFGSAGQQLAVAQFTEQRTWGATSGGSANAQTVTVPNWGASQVGVPLRFLAGFTNTSATTLNVSGTGAVNIFKATSDGPVALQGGEVAAGSMVIVVYDGTRFQLISPWVEPGTVEDWTGITPKSGYVWAAGQSLSTTTYANLYNRTTIQQTGTISSGTPNVTSLSDTSNMAVGMPVCGSGIQSGTTISVIPGANSLTLSLNATNTGATPLVVAPYGCGSGTFNVADLRGRVAPGRDNMNGSPAGTITTAGSSCSGLTLGAACSTQSVTLAQPNLPNTTLAVSGTVTTSNNGGYLAPTAAAAPVAAPGGAGDIFYNTGSFSPIAMVSAFSAGLTGSLNGGVTQTNVVRLAPLQVVNKIVKY